MKSTLLSTGLGYLYSLDDEYDGPGIVKVEITNLRWRNGSPYALFTTSTSISGARFIPGSNRVASSEIWLLSDKSRASYASVLDQRIPFPKGAAKLDWETMIDEVAQRVIEAESAPIKVERLLPSMVKSRPFVMDGIIPSNRVTILYGVGGTGKSILAATMAVAVQEGRKFLNFKTRQTEVLYLDWETDESDIAHRVQAASLGLGLQSMSNLRYSSLVRPIEDKVEQLAQTVAEEKIGLVVIDSVGMAMSAARDGADASETAIRFFRALRFLNTAVLAIDHVAGEDMRKGKGSAKPYGSVYKWNSARNAWELRKSEDNLILKHRKSNIGPVMDDITMTLDWTDDKGAVWKRQQSQPVFRMPLPEQVIDVLIAGPATPRQIADLLSDEDTWVGEMDVRQVVKTLLGEGKVTVLADGDIRLVRDDGAGLVDPGLGNEPRMEMG